MPGDYIRGDYFGKLHEGDYVLQPNNNNNIQRGLSMLTCQI